MRLYRVEPGSLTRLLIGVVTPTGIDYGQVQTPARARLHFAGWHADWTGQARLHFAGWHAVPETSTPERARIHRAGPITGLYSG